MKVITGMLFAVLLCSVGIAKGMSLYDELKCDPEFNVEADTPSFAGYTGSLMESAPVGRESCVGTDGLMHGEIPLPDAVSYIRYLFLSYKVADKKEKLSGFVFPIEIYISEERINERGHSAPGQWRIYVATRDKDFKDKEGFTVKFHFPRKSELIILDTDKGKIPLKVLGGSGGNAHYGYAFNMAVALDASTLDALGKIKECSMILPFSQYRAGETKSDLPPFTIRVTLTKDGIKNLKKFIGVAGKN